MDNRIYNIRISPEVIKNDIFIVPYDAGPLIPEPEIDPCCDYTTTTTTSRITGYAPVYSSMTQILSGGTNGTSLLTGLTIPIFLTQNTVDIGYYSAFDGFISQSQVFNNFLFSASTSNPNLYYFYNTSEKDFKKFLQFSNYVVDWGDGSPQQLVPSLAPNFYSHTYAGSGEFTIKLSGLTPWGSTLVQKTVHVPYTNVSITNPYGTAYFTPQGGSWSGTPLSLDYIFTGDSICDVDLHDSSNYTTVPFTVSGYTNSSINDLQVYGKKINLYGGKFKVGVQVTGASDCVGTFWGPDPSNTYTAYTINDIDYYDFSDGTTIFFVQSSGLTSDWLVCTGLTKEEAYMNVVEQMQVQSNIFINRGKNSGLEVLERLGEVDNIGDIEKYGYGFFKVINSTT
jgi:hypothetical protein